MAVKLTEGAIAMISSGEWQDASVKPVLQVMDVRVIQAQNPAAGGENKDRYRIMLSDGLFHQQGMLATQRNELIRSQRLQKGSIVQLTEFVCNTIRERIIIIVIDLDVIIEKCDIIGDAKPYPFNLPGSGTPPIARSAAPMQSSPNNPWMTTGNPQSLTGSSLASNVTGSNFSVGTPVRSAELHSSAHMKTETVAAISRPPASSYIQPVQSEYNQPPPMYMNRGPMAKQDTPQRIIPIAALNPYQGRWTIKARVTAKSEVRHYNNARGEGKVFSFDLLDFDGGEIRATCFNAVADQLHNQIESGKVYYISKGNLKPAQKAFNHLKNDLEIVLDTTSTIQPCFDDDTSIPHQQFHFRSIGEIEGMDSNSVLDIIGVVFSVSPTSSIMRKNGTETHKRTLHLKDTSGRSIELTLWGNFCVAEGQMLQNMCDSGAFPVLAVKSARVYDFNGKSLGTISTSQLCIEPDFPEAHKLKAWFDNVGRNTHSVSISRETVARTDVSKTISQIKDEKLGTSEKPDWITVNATIWHLKVENFCYTACPNRLGDRQCSKKVTNNGDGKWRCDKCDQTMDECDYRYILQLQIQDHTGLTWVTAFQESGEEIMGVSAKELYFMKYEEQDEDRFTESVRNVLFTKYNFKLKVKEEIYGDEQRVKSTIVKAEKINWSSNTRFLLVELQRMLKGEDPNSVATKSEIPNLDSRNLSFKETAPPAVNYAGSVTGIGQQTAILASQVSRYANQYGGSRLHMNDYSTNSTNFPDVVNAEGYSSGGRFNSSAPLGSGNTVASGECYRCHQSGHWARDCPGVSNVSSVFNSSMPSGAGNTTASGECYKCHQSGHWARDCPGVSNVSSGLNSSMPLGGGNMAASGECYKCHQSGHWARDCPGASNVSSGFNRGGNTTASGECYKCHQSGHWARDCPGVGNVAPGRYSSTSEQYVGY